MPRNRASNVGATGYIERMRDFGVREIGAFPKPKPPPSHHLGKLDRNLAESSLNLTCRLLVPYIRNSWSECTF